MEHFERAVAAFNLGRWEIAQDELVQHLSVNPNDAEALSLLAACCFNRGRVDEAILHAKGGVERDPEFAHGYYILCMAYVTMARLPKAFASIQRALALDPGNSDYLFALAKVLYEQEKLQMSLEALDLVLSLDANHVPALRLKAIVLLRFGHKPEATDVHERALFLAPQSAQLHADAGWKAMFHGGSFEEAESRFAEALRLNPQSRQHQIGLNASRLIMPSTVGFCVGSLLVFGPIFVKYSTEWGARLESSSIEWIVISGSVIATVSSVVLIGCLLVGRLLSTR